MEISRECYLGAETVPSSLTVAEIAFFFKPIDQTREVVERRQRPSNRLGVILHIGVLRMTDRPLAAFERVPPAVLAFAAQHARMSAPEILPHFGQSTAAA